MAFAVRELFSSVTGPTSGKRIIPTNVQEKEFAAGTLGQILPVGCLVTKNTSTLKWAPWVTAGANGTGIVKGIVYPEPIILDGTNSVLGVVMMRGEIHRGDCVAFGAETSNQIDAALLVGVRELGITIQGLAGFA